MKKNVQEGIEKEKKKKIAKLGLNHQWADKKQKLSGPRARPGVFARNSAKNNGEAFVGDSIWAKRLAQTRPGRERHTAILYRKEAQPTAPLGSPAHSTAR